MLAGLLPAPERPDARLRVELQRREPPGPRLCDTVPPSHRAGPARRSGPGLPQVDLQQAPAELHLVGQPQGPLRQERLRGRLPRPRQHRRVRPQRPASHRRPPRAGGRHGVDGPLQPEHAGARHRARRPRPHLPGHGLQVRGALLLHRRCHEPARIGRHVGRGGWLLLRHPAAARRQRHAAQGPLDGGAPATVRHHGDREERSGRASQGRWLAFRNGCAGCPSCGRPCTPPARVISAWPSGGSWPWSTRSGSAGSSPGCSTRTSSSAPTASARSRSSTSRTHMSCTWTVRSTGWTTCRPSRTPACSAATPTGGARSGCR